MSTAHAPTIQDGAAPFWKLSGADVLVLGTTDGQLYSVNAEHRIANVRSLQTELRRSIAQGQSESWWFNDNSLYWVFVRPITAGTGVDQRDLGMLAVGYEVDSRVATELARVARSEIALFVDGRTIASTISADGALLRLLDRKPDADAEVSIGSRQYRVASVVLNSSNVPPVQCLVLLPLDRAHAFLSRLNRTLIVVGIAAVLFGGLLFSVVSRAITRPLDNLVAGVRALEAGDFTYTISEKGSTELRQLGSAFANTRAKLLESQRHRIAAERMAALSRTASSISHDLRHYLAAVVANAEFLYESETLKIDREDVYREIRIAADQMTDLIESLRELSRETGSITPIDADLGECLRRGIDATTSRPEFRDRRIALNLRGDMHGVFDSRKLERAVLNLLLNACEATKTGGLVTVIADSSDQNFEITVADNGPGIPDSIRETLFDPFVSSGKENGTGLGLAIVQKIVRDHMGTVQVNRTSSSGTEILIRIPRRCASTTAVAAMQ
jgi:signal transduction histidine kinase